MLVPVVDQPVGDLLGPLAGLGRAEVVQEQQRAAGQRLQFPFAVVTGTGSETCVEVGAGGRFPAEADAPGEESAYGAVSLVGLACAGGAGDQQRRALRDARSAGSGATCSGDVVGPGGDLRLVGQGTAVAGGDPGVREFQCRDGLGRRFLGCDAGVDTAGGQDRVEPVGERTDLARLSGKGGGQRSPP